MRDLVEITMGVLIGSQTHGAVDLFHEPRVYGVYKMGWVQILFTRQEGKEE